MLPSPKLPETLPGDDSTKLAHFKINSFDHKVLRAYLTGQRRSMRWLADQAIALFLEHRSALHDAQRCVLYESPSRSFEDVGVFATRSLLLHLEAWADLDGQDYRTAYYNSMLFMIRSLVLSKELDDYMDINIDDVLDEEALALVRMRSELLHPRIGLQPSGAAPSAHNP